MTLQTDLPLVVEPTVAKSSIRQEWSPDTLKQISDDFEGRSPAEILHWAVQTFSPEIALATGFGPEGVVLIHLLSQIAPQTTVFYIDTDLFFAETYALRDELETRLGLHFTRIATDLSLEAQAGEHGPELWTRDPDLCCYLRKVEPLRRYLATQHAWITSIRRSQTRNRANAGLVEWDYANGLVKINPLAAWTSDQVWAYIREHDLPFNQLHLHGYPSIGCRTCTLPFVAGDDPRSGRWAGLPKTECGIHLQPAKKGNP